MNVRTYLAVTAMILGIAAILASVGGPAAVASYHHAYEVFKTYGEAEDRAAWLPLTTDGMLIAALVVMYSRRWAQQRIGFVPWLAFAVGFLGTIAANLASANIVGAADLGEAVGRLAAAVWAPISFAVTLELVAVMLGMVRNYVARKRAALDDTWPVTHFVGIPVHPYRPVLPEPVQPTAQEREAYLDRLTGAVTAAGAPPAAPRTRTPRRAASAPASAPAPAVPGAPAPRTNGHPVRWTDADETIRMELQEEIDAAPGTALPSVRSLKVRYKMSQERAGKIRARLVERTAPVDVEEPVR
jgi:hypothetical protein